MDLVHFCHLNKSMNFREGKKEEIFIFKPEFSNLWTNLIDTTVSPTQPIIT